MKTEGRRQSKNVDDRRGEKVSALTVQEPSGAATMVVTNRWRKNRFQEPFEAGLKHGWRSAAQSAGSAASMEAAVQGNVNRQLPRPKPVARPRKKP